MPDFSNTIPALDTLTLAEQIKAIGVSLGFQAVRFSSPSTQSHQTQYQQWVDAGYNGTMGWMAENIDKRFEADKLHAQTKTVISVRMDYFPADADSLAVLENTELGYIARYALGRDYHKVLRKRLTQFGKQIELIAGDHGFRPFVDSAPVMERQLAEQAGLGWIGKNTLLLAPGSGSWFFLGELFTNLELPFDPPLPKSHCGSCSQCLTDCPTDAFLAPGVMDARRCISYLTIEYSGSIPLELRPLMGNRIYGCDDCQLVCPHNRKAPISEEQDFNPRHHLESPSLLMLFSWDEATFLNNMQGSPIRRIGYEQWQRNIAIALGNGKPTQQVHAALTEKLGQVSALVDEHIEWALLQLKKSAHKSA